MLPMLYMPIAGEVVAQELGVEKMVPTTHTLDVWSEAQKLALAFWEAVVRKERISGGVQGVGAGECGGAGSASSGIGPFCKALWRKVRVFDLGYTAKT